MCYYAVGTRDELKEHRLLETGFLRRPRLLEGDFDRDFFTAGDKREMHLIALPGRKAKLLTNHPEGSYSLHRDDDGSQQLEITDPALFWSMSNFLVVEIGK